MKVSSNRNMASTEHRGKLNIQDFLSKYVDAYEDELKPILFKFYRYGFDAGKSAAKDNTELLETINRLSTKLDTYADNLKSNDPAVDLSNVEATILRAIDAQRLDADCTIPRNTYNRVLDALKSDIQCIFQNMDDVNNLMFPGFHDIALKMSECTKEEDL